MTSLRFLLLVLFLSISIHAEEPQDEVLPRNVLTNDGVMVLARSGLGETFLVELVQLKRSKFDTSAQALAKLARMGVAENVIRAMVLKQEPPPTPLSHGATEEPPPPQPILRGRIVKQKILVPDALGGDVALLRNAGSWYNPQPR